jgi:hypothetical protein
MDNLETLLLVLLIIYLTMGLLRPCSKMKEGFAATGAPALDIGTVRIKPSGKGGTNNTVFRFNHSFTRTPFVKLQALNDKQNMMGREVYSLTIRGLYPASCEVRVNRVDGQRWNAAIDKPFLIQYIAIEAPSGSP